MKNKLTRSEASEKLKNKIIDVSIELFNKYGYRETTTRQIVKKAGITTGSLYHFFKDKEDILLHTTLLVYKQAMDAADVIADNFLGNKDDTALRYAIIYALEMKAVESYERVAELYLETYSSWRITEVMMNMNVERNKTFFSRYNPDLTDEEYYIRTLALRGMRLAFLNERVHHGKIDYEKKCAFLIETGLSTFNVPINKTASIASRAISLTREDRFNIQGYNV